jgi:hypothetical protein
MAREYQPLQDWGGRDTCFYNGYTLVYVPEHPKSFDKGWYYEHRLFAEREYGRLLESWESVHHISENKSHNTRENLFVCTRTEHDRAVWRSALDFSA